MEAVLPDVIKKDLAILFIGINPGTRSGEVGHHFAGHSNRFWKFLAESGLTPSKVDALHDADLLKLNFGITNIVPRVTAAAAELAPAELRQGAATLRKTLEVYRPQIAVYLGKVVYQYLSGTVQFPWGKQADPLITSVIDFVIPNPSGLNRIPIAEQLEYYRELRRMVSGESQK